MIEKKAFLVEAVGEKRHNLTELAKQGSGAISIGRPGRGSTIELGQEFPAAFLQSISKHHATILRKDDGFYIQDNGSTNGTSIVSSDHTHRLNGEYVRLEDKDEIFFGNLYSVVYEEEK